MLAGSNETGARDPSGGESMAPIATQGARAFAQVNSSELRSACCYEQESSDTIEIIPDAIDITSTRQTFQGGMMIYQRKLLTISSCCVTKRMNSVKMLLTNARYIW